MRSELLLSLFIYGFPSTLFSFRTTLFPSRTDSFECCTKFQTDWVQSSTQYSLVIYSYCSRDYPVFCQCLLDWHLLIPLAHRMDIWLEFHLTYWIAWLMALKKDLWFYYHCDFNLDLHVDLQIMELRCPARWWLHLLGCVMDLKQSGFGDVAVTSRIVVNLISGERLFIASLPKYL